MRIELTRERYATLCAKAKKSALRKRTPIARPLAREEISGYENSAAKRPERVRRFCKANPTELWEERFCGFQQKRSRCSANRLVRIKTNRSWKTTPEKPHFPRKKPVCALFSVFVDTVPHPQTGAKTGVCGGNVRPRKAEKRSGQYCHKRKTDEIKVVFLTSPNFSATLPKSVRESRWQ